MGLIQDWLQRLREKKREKEDYERQSHVQESYHERKKSANERMLERFQEEDRQRRIKALVEQYKKAEDRKVWSGRMNNAIYTKNIIRGQAIRAIMAIMAMIGLFLIFMAGFRFTTLIVTILVIGGFVIAWVLSRMTKT